MGGRAVLHRTMSILLMYNPEPEPELDYDARSCIIKGSGNSARLSWRTKHEKANNQRRV